MSQIDLSRPLEKTLSRTHEKASDLPFVIWVTVILLAVTSLPYLYAYLSTPADRQYMGIMLDVPDHAQYFAWMRDLSTANLIENKLTPEPNQQVFFNLLWWMLGRLGRALNIGYAGMFQVLRMVAGVLFFLLLYRICGYYLKERFLRRTALLVALFTSGFGWLLVLIKYIGSLKEVPFPIDIYTAEGNTFFDLLAYPHFLAAALYIFVFDLMLRGLERRQLRYSAAAGLVAFFLGWQHAYDLVSVYGIVAVFTLLLILRDHKIPVFWLVSAGILGVLSWWPALYSVWLTSADPVWKQVLAQFANAGVFTPNPLHLPILLGPAFLLAIYTVARENPLKLKRLDNAALFLLAWFFTPFILIYLPVDYQIHLLNGWQVPIAILAVQGLYRYGAPFVKRMIQSLKKESPIIRPETIQKGLAVLLLAAVLPTNLYIFAWRFVDLSRHAAPYYLSKGEVEGLHWIEGQGSPEDVVLSSETLGQYVPMLTGKHAVLAHWAQTLDYYGKAAAVARFYSAQGTDAEREALIARYRVRYVLLGPSERSLGGASLDGLPFLQKVYSSGGIEVFEARETPGNG